MKPRFGRQRNQALTRIDVVALTLIVFFLLALFIAMLLPLREAERPRADLVTCASNLRQLNLWSRIRQEDNGQEQPMSANAMNVSLSNINSGQRAWVNFIGVSNLLSPTMLTWSKILHCPADTTPAATNDLSRLRVKISYFLNLDASEEYPQTLCMGDDNLAMGNLPAQNVPVTSGIFELSTNTPLWWNGTRHGHFGNVSFADGSVSAESSASLQSAVQVSLEGTPMSTNQLAIP